MERTIRVIGKGKISVKPDIIRLIITQTGTEPVHEHAVKESADRKSELNDALVKIGFRKEDLKTLYFNVNTEYENYRDDNGAWKQKFIGYKFTHRMKLEFPIEDKMLGKVLGVVAACTGEPNFTIQYTTSDPEKAKNELLVKAVEDSKAKAGILADAARVSLKDIVTIDYSWGQIDIVSAPINDLAMHCCKISESEFCEDSIDLDIEPDDIDITDTVTIVWSIE